MNNKTISFHIFNAKLNVQSTHDAFGQCPK